jgi:hypothetical protein
MADELGTCYSTTAGVSGTYINNPPVIKQDDYHFNIHFGFSTTGGDKIPADKDDNGLDVDGDPLDFPAIEGGHNTAETIFSFKTADDGEKLPAVNLANPASPDTYTFGDPQTDNFRFRILDDGKGVDRLLFFSETPSEECLLEVAKYHGVQATIPNGPLHGDVRTPINANFTELYDKNFDSVISVKSASDLPAAVVGVITLSTDYACYVFESLVDLGGSRIEVTGEGNCFAGVNVFSSGITSTNVGVLITATSSFKVEKMSIIGFGTHGLSCTDAGTETILLMQVAFIGFGLGILIDSYESAVIDTCSFFNCTNGIAFANTVVNGSIEKCLFTDVTGKLIDLDGCTSSAWNIVANIGTLTATSTFLTVAVDSGNINIGGQGTISANKIDNTLNGAPTAGYSPYDSRWTVIGNSNIPNSDTLAPTGWGNYEDSVAGTIAINTTPNKLTVDSLGGNTDIVSLPEAMIDAGSTLWDSTSHKITPATLRDSYALRVQVELDSVSGNPLRLILDIDIGGAVSPTIVISSDSKSIRGGNFPQSYLFSLPFFCKETFVANGGQVFLSTDTGSAVVGARSVFIERISSGVR